MWYPTGSTIHFSVQTDSSSLWTSFLIFSTLSSVRPIFWSSIWSRIENWKSWFSWFGSFSSLPFCRSSNKRFSTFSLIFSQARPYWVPNNSIESLEWNCYYEYGCPSGHSMMGLIIMEFILRFFSRVHKCILKYEWVFLILVAFLEFCIMLSRVILGMHSFNQVLFGCMLGLYTFVPYYLYVERLLTQVVMIAFKNPRSAKVTLAVVGCICLSILI